MYYLKLCLVRVDSNRSPWLRAQVAQMYYAQVRRLIANEIIFLIFTAANNISCNCVAFPILKARGPHTSPSCCVSMVDGWVRTVVLTS